MNYSQLINNLYDEIICSSKGNIDNGCCISDRVSLNKTEWKDNNKIFEWKCGHHKAFLLSLIEKSIYDIIHKLNIESNEQILNNLQINIFKDHLNNLMDECLLCRNLKNVDSKLKPFYRLPIDTGNNMHTTCISKIILDKDIRMDNPKLLDLEERIGLGLYVVHSLGISKIPVNKFYPIWQLYKKYITFEVISSWSNIIDGIEINDHLLILFDQNKILISENKFDDFIDIQNDINAPIEMLNEFTCYINNYNQINNNQLNNLLKNYSKIIIDYFKFQFIIEDKSCLIKFNDEIIKFLDI
jgi:hypothetical protein